MISEEVRFDFDLDQMDVLGEIFRSLFGKSEVEENKHFVSLVNSRGEPEVGVLVETNGTANVVDLRSEVSEHISNDLVGSAENISNIMKEEHDDFGFSLLVNSDLIDQGLENLEEVEVEEWDDLYEASIPNWELMMNSKDEKWAINPDIDTEMLKAFKPKTIESLIDLLLPGRSYVLISFLGEKNATLYLGFDEDFFTIGNLDLEEEYQGEKIKEILEDTPEKASSKLFEYFEKEYGEINLALVAETEELEDKMEELSELPEKKRLSKGYDALAKGISSEKIIIKTRSLFQPLIGLFVRMRPLIRPFLHLFTKS